MILVLSDSVKLPTGMSDRMVKMRPSAKCTFALAQLRKPPQKAFSKCKIEVLLKDTNGFPVANPARIADPEVSEEQTIVILLLKKIMDKVIGEVGSKITNYLKRLRG